LHPSQLRAVALAQRHRFVALCCGRRWGKSAVLIALAVDAAMAGKSCGLFAPSYKLAAPTFSAITRILAPVAVSAA
jgi:hypothetical protein